jgi:hypothetical protein
MAANVIYFDDGPLAQSLREIDESFSENFIPEPESLKKPEPQHAKEEPVAAVEERMFWLYFSLRRSIVK